MSPILTRPIREQLEHDRIIRQLQARYKRKHDVAINPGAEHNQSVMVGELAVYPDLLLYGQDQARRLEGTVEVETGESVNQLEALAEWGVFSKLKVPFHLYVPPQSLDSARRMCDEHQFPVAEIWTYHMALDQVRFTQVYRAPGSPRPEPHAKAATPKAAAGKEKVAAKAPAKTTVKRAAAKSATKSAVKSAAKPAAKPASKPAPAKARAAKAAKPARVARPAARKTAKPAPKRAAVKKR